MLNYWSLTFLFMYSFNSMRIECTMWITMATGPGWPSPFVPEYARTLPSIVNVVQGNQSVPLIFLNCDPAQIDSCEIQLGQAHEKKPYQPTNRTGLAHWTTGQCFFSQKKKKTIVGMGSNLVLLRPLEINVIDHPTVISQFIVEIQRFRWSDDFESNNPDWIFFYV